MGQGKIHIYLLGEPKFTVITGHKPLVPMFNNATAKLPPRIEKWIMQLQDVDLEVKYRLGRNELDPLDYLSRHPLPTTESTEQDVTLKRITNQEHVILIDDIQEATLEDTALQRVLETRRNGEWQRYRRDPDMEPYYHIREELYKDHNMIIRDGKIVLPTRLPCKTVKIGHELGHLHGTNKNKGDAVKEILVPSHE